jgi:pimeloyl-ACP methyl ester carboxylesterase
MKQPKTSYAKNDSVSIAYQVFGDGPNDLVIVPGFISHIELMWEIPAYAEGMERIGRFARVIKFDKRGTGLSDPVSNPPSLEIRMDDVKAVMDAAGSEKAVLFGASEGAAMSMLFAATYPDRATGLILYGGLAKGVATDDYPWAPRPETFEKAGLEFITSAWGEGASGEVFAPSIVDIPGVREWGGRYERMASSPGGLAALYQMFAETDVRHVLSSIGIPTLIIHRKGDRAVNVRNSRYLAENISGARYLELEGIDHELWAGDTEAVLGEIEEFITGVRTAPEPDRMLATVLFTDIVDSTKQAAALGDRRWRDVLESHQQITRKNLERFKGQEIKTTGDGFLAIFDGPARGIRCAQQIRDDVRTVGVEIRAGLHTGEVEKMGTDIGGIGVHIGARVGSLAGSSEVLVSRTVKDLVAGSGIQFEDRGTHELKGVPDSWQIYAVTS